MQKGSQIQWRGDRGAVAPTDKILVALKSKGGDKIRNGRRLKIRKVQLVNKFKDSSNSGISIAIRVSNCFCL